MAKGRRKRTGITYGASADPYRGRRAGSGYDACSELPIDFRLRSRYALTTPARLALVRQLKTTAKQPSTNQADRQARRQRLIEKGTRQYGWEKRHGGRHDAAPRSYTFNNA
ncbi:hypothetical protein Bbelb_054350 [Branchiostoma belcheri]|nr:hypothetical protein Bbelb_054350 [Branchiostoma belcheri]